MSNKKRGFTLIEVLGILVILAIIATIATPSILNVFNDSEKNTVKSSAQLIAKAAQEFYSSQMLEGNGIDKISLTDDTLVFDGDKPEMGYAYFDEEGRTYIKMYHKGYCVVRTYDGKVTLDKVPPTECTIAEMVSVTLYSNGGTISTTDKWSAGDGFVSTIVEFATKIDEEPTIERLGYTFKGWFTNDELEINLDRPITENLTGTAKWRANTYNVTFDLAGGTMIGNYDTTRRVTYDTAYGALPGAERYGYTFRGWYTLGGVEVLSDTVLKIANDHTLYARWEAVKFDLTLDALGGTMAATDGWTITGDKATKKVVYATYYENLLIPFKRGYTFNGWYTLDDKKVDETTMVAGPLTVYARWTANKYVVSFNSSGGNVIESIEVTYDQNYGELPVPVKKGNKFLGWRTQGGELIESTSVVQIVSDTTLYADWELITYKITFDALEGTIPSSATNDYYLITSNTAYKEVVYSEQYGVLPSPTRDGYRSLGWYDSSNNEIKSTTVLETDSDHTLYVKWESNEYTVTFDSTGGTSVSNMSVIFGQAYGTLPSPTKTGYTFNGWATSGGVIVSKDTIVTTPNNHTLYAQWGENTYLVTFNGNGGSVGTPTKEVTFSKPYGTLSSASRTGYTFSGWYYNNTEITADTEVTVADNHTLTAGWTANEYTVTFEENGGTAVSDIKVTYDSTYGTLPTTTKTGYTFLGWYTTGGSKIESTTKVAITATQTLYAEWSANSFTVSFDSHGGSSVANIKVTYDQKYGTLTDSVRAGYTFQGWFTAASGGTKVLGTDTVKITEDTTLHAQWAVNSYTITFVYNNGQSNTTKSVTYDSEYGTLPSPTWTGRTFDGWYTSGGSKIESTTIVKTASNQELYAQWTANEYTVTFVYNNGSANTTKKVTYGQPYGDLPSPTKTGYTFVGWYDATTGGNQILTSTTVAITANQTLYARWTPKQYTVTLVYGNGDDNTTITVTYDSTYGTLPSPIRTGYTYNGWATSGGTVVTSTTIVQTAGDHSIYAQWGNNTYLVTFNGNGGTAATPTKNVTFDEAYGTLSTASRTGYTFNGWYYNNNKIEATTIVSVADNHTLTANWTANKYTVTLVYNDDVTANGTITVTYDDYYQSLPTPTRTGYTFAGWYTTGGVQITTSTKVTMAENHTVSAQWTANKYTVSLAYNDETQPNRPLTGTYGSTYADLVNPVNGNTWGLGTPVRAGYTFKGWYTAASGGTKVTTSTKITTASNHTLYAQWTGNSYTVTLEENGGTSMSDLSVTYGSTYSSLTNPTRTGYTFKGWTFVPDTYQQVEYIQTDGNQMINTGVTGNARWEFDIQIENNGVRQLMGYGGTSGEYWGVQKDGQYGILASSTTGNLAGNRDRVIHNFNENGTCYLQANGGYVSCGGPTTNPYYLFNLSGGSYGMTAKLYGLKTIQNGELIRNFVPCYRKSDGVVGLYDTVNNAFYTNVGTGSFTYGSTSYLPDTYQRVDYIKSSGTQWINSGVVIRENTWVNTDLMFDSAFGYNMMFGSWSNNFAVALKGVNTVTAAVGGTSSQNIGTTTTTGVKYNIVLGPGKGYVQNGVTTALGETTNSTNGRTILLFGASAYSEDVPYSWTSFGVGKIYSFKIYTGTTGDTANSSLVRDFIPCYRISDNVVGMYDAVEGKFYANSGTGSFTYGSKVTTSTDSYVTSSTLVNTPAAHKLYANWSVISHKVSNNFNTSYSFLAGEYADTGHIINWDKDFTITQKVVIPSIGSRILLIGNYNGSDTKALNIEVHTDGTLRVWIGASTGAHDKYSTGTFVAGDTVTVTFSWDAETDNYIVTANGSSTSITMSNTYAMSGTSANGLRIGTQDLRGSTVFIPITTSSLNITYERNYGAANGLGTASKPGHTFNGWYTASSGGTKLSNGASITSDLTTYGQWAANTYTVTFSPGSGTIPSGSSWTGSGTSATKTVTYGSTYGTLPTPTQTGRTFTTWSTTGGVTITSSSKVTMTSNHTLYASYGNNDVIVTYNANNCGTSAAANKTVKYSEPYGTLAGFTAKAGYTFKGWYTASSGGTAVTSSTTVGNASAHNIYAQCTPNTYTVTYDYSNNLLTGHADQGSTTGYRTTYSISNKVVTVKANYDDGYDFTTGRFSLVAGTTYKFSYDVTVTSGSTEAFLMLDGGLNTYYHMGEVTNGQTLTKVFTPAVTGTYWLRLDVNTNGATGKFSNIRMVEAQNKTVTYNSTYGTQPTPTRYGYNFNGWATSGGTAVTSSTTVSTASNHTLYAQWSAMSIGYTVNYVSTTGASLGSETVTKTYGTTATITPPAKTGYTTKSSAISVTWDTTTAKTFTFTYEPITYTVTVDCNGGSGVSSTTYNIETATFTLGTPTRSYYNFTGWTGTSSGTTITISKGSTGNKSYTANWQNIIYTVTPGTYISYTGNGYTSWRVMFNNSGQLDIVSAGSAQDVSLSGNDGYSNAVLILNNTAQNYIAGYATSARSIGCTSASQNTVSVGSSQASLSSFPFTDTYYQTDFNQLVNNGLVQTDKDVWLASRTDSNVESVFGQLISSNGSVRTITTSGTLDWWSLQTYAKTGWSNAKTHTYGFRPVVSLKSGLLITGGSGTSSSPYVVSG